MENIKEQIEEVIKKNLPEKINNEHADKDAKKAENPRIAEMLGRQAGFNQAISSIDTSLIADEVLKVVVEKIDSLGKGLPILEGDIWMEGFLDAKKDILELLNY